MCVLRGQMYEFMEVIDSAMNLSNFVFEKYHNNLDFNVCFSLVVLAACLCLFNHAAVGLCQVPGCCWASRCLVGCTVSGCRIGPLFFDWNFL